jgi:hypothetical protein
MTTGNEEIIRKDLTRKIEFEHRKYNNYLLLCSQADVISRAKEIYIKRLIYERLLEEIEEGAVSDDLCEYLLASKDVISMFYMKAENRLTIEKDRIQDEGWKILKSAVKF